MIVTITESVNANTARLWLGANTRNRRINQAHVRHYAQQMAEGRWRETGATIQIGKSGALLDGQHRLLALLRAAEKQPDLAIRFQIARGVEDEAFAVIDTGKARNAGDALQLAGYTSGRNLSAVAAFHLRASQQSWGHSLPDHEALIAYIGEHPSMADGVALHAPVRKIIARPTLFGALGVHAIERGVSMDHMRSFANSVRDGVNLTADSPALALRNWAMQRRIQGITPLVTEEAYVIFRAMRDGIHGTPLRRLASTTVTSNFEFDVEELAPRTKGGAR